MLTVESARKEVLNATGHSYADAADMASNRAAFALQEAERFEADGREDLAEIALDRAVRYDSVWRELRVALS